jgi:clan AA aspartic protease (TIGR02281 family)
MAASMTKAMHAMYLILLVGTSPAASEGVLLQAQNFMFRTDIVLNERIVVDALIDTGATYLSLCAATARGLRLKLGSSVELATANGNIQGRFATIDSIRIGPIVVRSITAVVKSEGTPCTEGVVVGMSVLHKLGSMTLKNGTLTLTGAGRD